MSCGPEECAPAPYADVAGDALVSIDAGGVVVEWDEQAAAMFGWPAQEAVGRALVDLVVPAELAADHLAGLARRRAAGELAALRRRLQVSARHRDGHVLPVEVTVWATGGTSPAYTALVRDLSEQHALTAALDASQRQLQAALDEAQRAEERVRSFLADAAHQLRRPVTGVRACAEALLVDPSQPDRQRLLAGMVRETERAGRLLAALLRMARLDQGEQLDPAPCDVVALCTDEADRIYSLAPQLDIVLRAEPVEDPTPALDELAVREILSNLLDNARRYAVARIDLTVTVHAGTVTIAVGDDGPGLPADGVERAFERFVTLDQHGGSGLGLPIARELARAHGGDLVYDGAAFALRLPAR